MSPAAPTLSGVPLEILVSIDDLRDRGMTTARGLLTHLPGCGADAVKLVACRPEAYSTRPLRVTHMVSRPDRRMAQAADAAPTLPPGLLADIRAGLPGMRVVVAPYDIASCLDLAGAGVDGWQVDEAMNANLPLLEAIAGVASRVYFSTWGCTPREIDTARSILHATELVFLHRVRGAPASALLRDCATIAHLCDLGHRVGWSESRPTRSHATIALAVGASVVQIPATTGEVEADAAVSRVRGRIRDLRALAEANRRSLLLGYTPDELDRVDERRPGLVAACPIPAGAVLHPDMVAIKAPASGLSVEHLPFVLGRRTRFDLREDDPISFGIVL